MEKKKHIGNIVTIGFTDKEETLEGLIINYNEDWTLMRPVFFDYMLDGYLIFKHQNLKGYKTEDNKFREKVVNLKAQKSNEGDTTPITDLKTILNFLTKKYGLFLFHLKSETSCYVGKVKSLTSSYLTIDYMNTKGQWKGQMKFRPGNIRIIEFDTDYLNSLQMIQKLSAKAIPKAKKTV